MRLPFRPTVRGRLTLLLAALVVLTGVVLPAIYLLVRVTVISKITGGCTPGPGCSYVASHSLVGVTLRGFLGLYVVTLAILAVIAGVLAWLVAGRMLRPLRRITDAARRITGEDLHERLALGGPADELTELGDTFDAMLARLEAAFTDQQLFAANAAHELRTPLAVMRAELDLILTGPPPSPDEVREAATRLRRAVLSAERLLERLLSLARGMVAPGEREPVRLDEIARRELAAVQEAARAQGLAIHPELSEACAYGDPGLIAEVAGNLLDNAVKYNRPRGWIAVDTHAEADRAVLEVSSSGQQIADPDLARLLEPFRRAGPQRIGDSPGLGLSIVRAIVAAHGGELALRALPDGGLAVRVSLPVVPAPGDGLRPVSLTR